MKKLHLDALTVDSFATTATVAKLRGTVAAHATGQCSAVYGCVDSIGGTCWVTCFDSCYCETDDCV
ncbi:hypothetical protein SAMN05216486_10811 [bacterium JGI 053]|nr:hypothetical protein SAMN05216486_10811 [bacterium JGI 053]